MAIEKSKRRAKIEIIYPKCLWLCNIRRSACKQASVVLKVCFSPHVILAAGWKYLKSVPVFHIYHHISTWLVEICLSPRFDQGTHQNRPGYRGVAMHLGKTPALFAAYEFTPGNAFANRCIRSIRPSAPVPGKSAPHSGTAAREDRPPSACLWSPQTAPPAGPNSWARPRLW